MAKVAVREGIPIRNLWLLMFYASELRHQNLGQIGTEKTSDELPDLVAEILCYFVERRLRRNLSQSYVDREAVLNRVRGRIDHLQTARDRLMDRGQIACRFQELTLNTPRNCYVRGALAHLATLVADRELRHTCRMLAGQMLQRGVTGRVPTRAQILNERFGRHDADDQPMIEAAKLAFELKIPTEQAALRRLLRPEDEAGWLRRLFERAVAGFYEITLQPRGWRVSRNRKHYWPIENPTDGVSAILPGMETDIILEHPGSGRRIIIDTKFTAILKTGRHDTTRLKSGYLYQLYAYLRTQEGIDSMADQAEGLLLHPAIDCEVGEAVTIQGHRMRFETIDLAGAATEIRRGLLARVGLDLHESERHLRSDPAFSATP